MTTTTRPPLYQRPWSMSRLGPEAGYGLPIPLGLFVFSMIVPADLAFEISELRLEPQRVALLSVAPWVLVWMVAQRRIAAQDLCFLAAGLWAATASLMHLPLDEGVERGGSFFLETAIAYILPSVFLTNAAQIRSLIRALFFVVAVLAPLAAMEAHWGEHVIANWAAAVWEEPEPFKAEERLGLLRARVTFAHQILFGVFCASLLAFFWYEALSRGEQLLRAGVCAIAVFYSLSSAAILLFALQGAMIAAEAATRRVKNRLRWLAGAAVLSWIAIELIVRGGLVGFVTRYLSLNPSTAYYRQLIWAHIIDDIEADPLIGTGGFWTRPAWMVTSIDHVYFTKAIKYGVPVIVFWAIGVFLIARALHRIRAQVGSAHRAVTLAWLFAVAGLAVAGLTVDYFGRSLPFVMFVIGLGAAWARIAAAAPSTRRAL